MEDRRCPVCRSDVYLNPDIVLYVSPCFHKMCESCIFRIFSKGQAPCPECGTMLRKVNYIKPTFEDMAVEKECKIRRTLFRAFSRDEDEFQGDTEKYNDYLEAFEELVFEVLGFKSDMLVKDRIKEIQAMGSECILNPAEKIALGKVKCWKDARQQEIGLEEDVNHKMRKVGLFNDYFDPSELADVFVELKEGARFPDGVFKLNTASGVINDLIASFAVWSLEELKI
ncbi:putative CDK-activating kinase assembly factor [Ordospora colligata]|uniref:Putative CDK-activating kinase assembly factor n=1 Tax=Ordospora colligata OC4 TaxID=1354746 RepID=A0A0B2UIK7_9MICR|nr:putative CDK-activating kinase assembly factor [Ordospora colligata OC4]KHN68790.1 putative CDK-activating kinase assembly factor [Ordospora colligata OC4]TBU13824.1 putative CDK-activating kinase assembly factor [Ordospora colligata]TBU14013.1 putative CDK-activating kinase assembly factor [Ordospora colligata]TBU17682.1 putative CDK-activating kinase assembly factor [Ordospora colligata]